MTKHSRRALAFGMTMLSSACLNNLFVTYYLEMFTVVATLDERWFYAGQIVFMVWNSINDPLFGWLSDRGCCTRVKVEGLDRRLHAIRFGGPLWVVAFMMTWFASAFNDPDSQLLSGLYFLFVLCFYDGMLTYVEVNHSAMLAEMTTSESERANANMYSALCAAVGSLSSFFSHMYWNPENLWGFRVFCLFIGIVALVGFEFTVLTMKQPAAVSHLKDPDGADDGSHDSGNDGGKGHLGNGWASDESLQATSSGRVSFSKFANQLLMNRNFKIFCLLNFLQIFDCTFEKNFLGTVLANYSGRDLSLHTQGLVVSMSFVLPWLCTIFLTPVVKKHGVYNTLSRVLVLRLGITIIGISYAAAFAHLSWLYLLTNRVVCECVCRLLPLVTSDLIDEDTHLHQRKVSLGASVVGAAALVGKSGQSLAPMLGYRLIAHRHAYAQAGTSTVVADNTSADQTGMATALLVAMVPCVVVVCELFLWKTYSLHGAYLKKIHVSASRVRSASGSGTEDVDRLL